MPDLIDLPLWVVYDHPADHPEHIVVRRQVPTTDGGDVTDTLFRLYNNLDNARAFCGSMGLHCLARQPGDDPCIVETWI